MKNPSIIDPNGVQVLLCDLQPPIVARSKTTPTDTLVQSAAVLAEIAGILGVPVTVTVVSEDDKPPTLPPALAERVGNAPQLVRTAFSPFHDDKTRDALAANKRKTLIVAGFATEVVVLHAVAGALDAGYYVYVPVDACGGLGERTEAAAFRQIEAVGGVTTSVVSLATAMVPDIAKSDNGKRVFQAVQKLRLA